MRRIEKVLDVEFDALTNKDWDNVLIVVGDEGTGKSTLLLHLLDYWCKKKYGKCEADHIKFMNLDIGQWADSLAGCNKADMNILDEGGDLSGRRTMSNLNVAVSRAYQIIRGDNINSILALPDLFWLDGFFTKRRARGLIKVFARGRFAFWSRNKLRRIIDYNSRKILKNEFVIRPTFYDTFPKYEGILKIPYMEKKASYMKDTRKELAETINNIKGNERVDPVDLKVVERKKDGLTNTEIAKELSIDVGTVGKIWKKMLGKQLVAQD